MSEPAIYNNRSFQVEAGANVSPTGAFTSNELSHSGKGISIKLAVTAIASGQGITLSVTTTDPEGHVFQELLATEVTSTGMYVYQIYPGATAGGTAGTTTYSSLSKSIDAAFQIVLTFADTSGAKAVTYNLSYVVLV